MTVCEARNRRGEPCRRPAGWGTEHPGDGRCKLHGGAVPIRHGRYSKISRPAVSELEQRFLDSPDLFDFGPLVAKAKTYVELFEERFGYLLRGESGRADLTKESAALRTASELVESAARAIERAERTRAINAISQPEFFRLMREMGRVVETYVPDEETLKKIRDGWIAIRVNVNRPE